MKSFSLNCVELQEYQKNRYPFLMIDHVDEVIPGESAKGYKNLTMNEWFFPVHYPDEPNMPGVLQQESLAQMLTIAIKTLPGYKEKSTRFISTNMKFHKEILPGDKMILDTRVTFWSRGIFKGTGISYTNGTIAGESEMVICFPDILEQYLPKKNTK
jgi:3-hydroxyacyl-[acyl-carrier-protein] dehydratase